MKPEMGYEIEGSGQLRRPEPDSGSNEPAWPQSDSGSDRVDHGYAPRIRPSETNGFAIYTMNKSLKSRIGFLDKLHGGPGALIRATEAVNSNGGDTKHVGGAEGNLGILMVGVVEREGELMEIEVKGEEMVMRSEGPRSFIRSVFKSNDEESELDSENLGNLRDTVIVEVDELLRGKSTGLSSPNARKMEMKMSQKILLKGRPATVRELFETGLVEGYPVFYNGGKRVLC